VLLTGHSLTKEEIRKKYIRSATFYLDALAVLPTEILAPVFSNPWRYVAILKLNRLLKMWKVCMHVCNTFVPQIIGISEGTFAFYVYCTLAQGDI